MSAKEHSPILRKTGNGDRDDRMESTTVRMMSERSHNYILSILCVFFGIGTWLPINAIFTQMPIFTQTAPEGWSLPSYFTLSVQISNVAPFLYYCFHKHLVDHQAVLICIFLCAGTVSLMLMSFTYNILGVVFGYSHSVYFFLTSFFPAALGCISSVLFLPFMQRLPELYLVPFFIGEGLSGLIPGLISAVQDIDREVCQNGATERIPPRFSTTVFLLIMGCFMVLSTMSFIYLNYFSNFVERIDLPNARRSYNTESPTEDHSQSEIMSKKLTIILLLVQTIINSFSNGILPSIQSYSIASYGAEPYHWSVLLNLIVSPLVMYIAFFVPFVSTKVLSASLLSLVLCLVYEVAAAVMRPPPMAKTSVGAVIIVLVWMIGSGLISYTKLSIATIFRRKYEAGLINYGFMTQVGSMLGAVLSFIMINYFTFFQEEPKRTCTINT